MLDEITWFGGKDPTFLGKLKTAWDTHFKKNPELILILTGSISGWIEKNIFDNPFFQRSTKKMLGCQIDYLIQTRDGMLYVCEIKFSQNKISCSVIKEVKQKIAWLKRPKYCSVKPVLIHVNGISPDLGAEEYFSHIVDLGDLLHD